MTPPLAQAPTGLLAASKLNLLTFKVAGQLYGVPVEKVIRIIEMVAITHIPEAPNSIEGIINLHGQAVPVMDMHTRFGLPHPTYGLHTPIVLVKTMFRNEKPQPLALVVDSVQQVVEVSGDALQQVEAVAPGAEQDSGPSAGQASYLAGLVNVDRQMIVLLNIPALLRPHERASLLTVLV